MTTPQIIRLVLMSLVFLVWAWLMFRTLFLIRRRNAENTGRMFPTTGGFLRQAGRWLTSPEDRANRRTLGFLTFVLCAMIAMQALIPGG